MKGLARLAGRALLALGWLSLLIGVAAFALERSGVARRLLLDVVGARLGVLGGSVHVRSVDFRWLEAGAELRGLVIEEDGRELLHVERLHAGLGFDLARGLELARLEIDRGSVLFGPTLSNGLRGLFDLDASRAPVGARGPAPRLPVVQVRGLDLSLEMPNHRGLPLGRLDLAFEHAASDAAPPVRGLLTLPSAPESKERARVALEGRIDEHGVLDLQASALDLHLEDIELPELAALDRLRDARPSGLLTLDGRLRSDLTRPSGASGNLRLFARDASLLLSPDAPAIDGIELDLEASYAPSVGQDLWTAAAWNARARFAARFRGATLRGGARGGAAARRGELFEAWARAPSLALSDELDELFGESKWLHDPWVATRVEGPLDLELGLRCDAGWRPNEALVDHLEGTARVSNAAVLRGRWLGTPPLPGEPRVAFPLPVTIDALRVVFSRAPRFRRPELLALQVAGEHPSGPVEASFTTWSHSVDATGRLHRADKELYVSSPVVELDDELARALEGVESSEALRELFPTYCPRGGFASVEYHLAERGELPHGAARVRVELRGASASWSELPLAASAVDGRIEYRSDGRGEQEVAFDLRGRLAGAEGFALAGRRRESTDPRAAASDPNAPSRLELESIELDARGLQLDGKGALARRVVGARWPGVGAALDRFGPSGRADLRFARTLAAAGGEVRSRLAVLPREGVELRPAELPLAASDVRGRVLTRGVETSAAEDGRSFWTTRVTPLAGLWPGGARVAMQALFPPDDEPSRVRVYAAGVEPGAMRGELALRNEETAHAPVAELAGALAGFELTGAVDVASELGGAGAPRHAIHFRRNDLFAPPKLRLEHLQGRVELAGDALESDRVSARLGRTPFALRDARFDLGPTGERHLTATLQARDVALDREPLELFLDEPSVTALVDEFGWRGRLDVPGWRLDWRTRTDGNSRLELGGDLTLTDVHVEIGLPLSIGSASGRIHELVVENGVVRGYGELFDLYGELVGREVGPARLLVSLFGSRLSIDAIEGSFVRGAIHGLDEEFGKGESFVRPAPVLAIDLEPPYPFQLAAALEDVDVSLLLRDLFPSSIADRGRLSGELRLSGDVDDVLSIRGAGRGELQNARLWSIPVFRDLFSQLGFEDTAVFDAMKTRFTLEDGVVTMRDIEVRSPILKLIGQGTLDLDGTLKHDFEVRYSVVDKIGILKQLVYLVQNTLLSVSIRGDMSRPVVILRGALTALFGSVDDELRSIPLPEYSELPERF